MDTRPRTFTYLPQLDRWGFVPVSLPPVASELVVEWWNECFEVRRALFSRTPTNYAGVDLYRVYNRLLEQPDPPIPVISVWKAPRERCLVGSLGPNRTERLQLSSVDSFDKLRPWLLRWLDLDPVTTLVRPASAWNPAMDFSYEFQTLSLLQPVQAT